MSDIEAAMRGLLDHVVDQVPGVSGALVSSIDGFVLAARLPWRDGVDPAGVAAMSAAALQLADRLAKVVGDAAAELSHQRSADGQAFVFAVSHVAAFTVFADAHADPAQIRLVGLEVAGGLDRLFRNAAD